jgi:hypothetical protein
MKTAHTRHDIDTDITVVAVAPLLWAVFPCGYADTAVGHIDSDGIRYRVALAGEELEPYTFATLREGTEWFAEYRSALRLGCPS